MGSTAHAPTVPLVESCPALIQRRDVVDDRRRKGAFPPVPLVLREAADGVTLKEREPELSPGGVIAADRSRAAKLVDRP